MDRAAWAVTHTKNSYLASNTTLSWTPGNNRAVVAVAHSIFVISLYHLKHSRQYDASTIDPFLK